MDKSFRSYIERLNFYVSYLGTIYDQNENIQNADIESIYKISGIDKQIIRNDFSFIIEKSGFKFIGPVIDEDKESTKELAEQIRTGNADNMQFYIEDRYFINYNTVNLYTDEIEVLNKYQKEHEEYVANSNFFDIPRYKIKESYKYKSYNNPIADDILMNIDDCINSECGIKIKYKKKNGDIFECEAFPIKIIYDSDENKYSVLCLNNGNVYVYNLEQIQKVSINYKFIKTDDYEKLKNKVLDIAPQVWGNCFTEEPIHVKVKFYKEASVPEKVKQDIGCRTKCKLTEDEKNLYFEDDVYGRNSFRRWIYKYGSSAIVLEPKDLRDEIIKSYEARREIYKNILNLDD